MKMIFHYPLPLDENSRSASGIRPVRMLNAFESLGYEIDLVSGYSSERKSCIARIKDKVRHGVKYDFVYSESSTMPTILTDPHHLPLHPFMDWFFFRFCKNNGIPAGLFYRDIYWLFGDYGANLNLVKVLVAKTAYRLDLLMYSKYLTRLYLPSIEMGKYVPNVMPSIFEALPPGHISSNVVPLDAYNAKSRSIRLFYVGGMSAHYQLHELFKAVSELQQVELTVCTREPEWEAVKSEYFPLPPNINVVHESGLAMEAHLQAADIAVLFVKPQEYREFASPVKLYEYIGFCKPILASDGTLAGRFVRDNGIGWTVPYEQRTVQQLLAEVADNPSLMKTIHANLLRIETQHSWHARAQQVIEGLSQ